MSPAYDTAQRSDGGSVIQQDDVQNHRAKCFFGMTRCGSITIVGCVAALCLVYVQFFYDQNPHRPNSSNVERHVLIGSNAAYVPPPSPVKSPEGCRAAYLYFVGRHCARHLSSLDALTHVEALPLSPKARAWALKTRAEEENRIGDCFSSGLDEQFGIGQRLRLGYRELFQDSSMVGWDAEATWENRTRQSAASFFKGMAMESLSTKLHFVPRCYGNSTYNYSRLRFFDTCKRYVKNKDTLGSSTIETLLASHAFASMLNRIRRKLLSSTEPAMSLPLQGLLNLCGNDVLSGIGTERWCSVLDSETLRILNLRESLADCFEKGPCAEEAFLPAGPLLADFVERTSEALRARQTPGAALHVGALRFAHAETVAPFAALLGVWEDAARAEGYPLQLGRHDWHPFNLSFWAASSAIPMSANVQIGLFVCDQDPTRSTQSERVVVRILYNEREITFPASFGECHGQSTCSWAVVEKAVRRRLARLGYAQGEAGEREFQEVCGGLLGPSPESHCGPHDAAFVV